MKSKNTLFLIIGLLLVVILALVLNLYYRPASTNAPSSQTTNSVPLSVASIDMSVYPPSVSDIACGTSTTFTYDVVFHTVSNNKGGAINFEWTANNGRSSTPASVQITPGETLKAYSFSTTGIVSADHTYPGIAEIMISKPNELHSVVVQPTGACH